jgi:uncharacterized damage-inducible protein DinB
MMSENRLGDTSVLAGLFRHNLWANLKLLDFCAGLSDEQLAATAVGAYGSIRATLAHMTGAEADYASRATGKAPPAWLSGDEYPGFDVLNETAREAGEELSKLAVAARADTVVRETDPQAGVSVEYPLSSLLLQAITTTSPSTGSRCPRLSPNWASSLAAWTAGHLPDRPLSRAR